MTGNEDSGGHYRPWVLDATDEDGRERIERLQRMAARGEIKMLDRVDDLRGELRKLVTLDARWRDAPSTRWVYFPWRATAVHLLAPPHFNLLRCDRNRNKLTTEEQERLQAQTVTVIGLSVGHQIAFCLAMEGLCGRIKLADFDTIELSNLNRVPATVLDIGVNKAVVVARRIAEIDPYLPVEVEARGATADTVGSLLEGTDILVEVCDSLDVKVRLRELARRLRIPVLMETSDRGLLDVERFDLEPHRPMLHGLMEVSADELGGLTSEEKVAKILRFLEASQLSTTFAASLVEVGRTITTWPQLGGDVTLGAATISAAVRRLGRGQRLPSGRLRIDLVARLDDLREPSTLQSAAFMGPPPNLSIPVGLDLPQRLAAAGNLAPSGGNCQPWRFAWVDQRMELRVDPNRITNRLDVGWRGAYLALGAAAENMRVVAAADGRSMAVETLNEAGELVVRVVSTRDNDGVDFLARLAPSVTARCTNRRKAFRMPLRPEHVDALEEAASVDAPCSWLRNPVDIHRYAVLLGEADRARYLTPSLHDDLIAELRFPEQGSEPPEDGIDLATLELEADDMAKLEIIRRGDVMAQLRSWGVGRALTEATVELVDTSAAICAVTVNGRSDTDFVRGGQALQRLWLTATSLGIAVQPVAPAWVYARNEPDLGGIFAPEFVPPIQRWDEEMADLLELGSRSLVLVLRLGYAPPPTARSGRRPPPLRFN
jgi:molybdopterin/thiamine biosynthesis adenylyltransferase/nitroreductase